MHWTEANVVALVLGIAAIIGGVTLFRHRAAAYERITAEQEQTFGPRVGQLMRETSTPMIGVGVPAIASIIIGVMCLVLGISGIFGAFDNGQPE